MCYFPITWILFMVSNDIASVWWHLLWNPFLWQKNQTKQHTIQGFSLNLRNHAVFINLSFSLACTFHISSGDSHDDFELTMCSLIILQSTAFPPNPAPRPSSPTVENGTSIHPGAQALDLLLPSMTISNQPPRRVIAPTSKHTLLLFLAFPTVATSFQALSIFHRY